MKKLNLSILAIIILTIAGGVLAFLIYDINNTEKSLAQSLIQKPMQSAEGNLKGFFSPVESTLLSTRDHAVSGAFDSLTPQTMNNYFSPLIRYFPQLSSIGLANEEGFEYNVLPGDSTLKNRVVWVEKWGEIEKWGQWEKDSGKVKWIKIKEWEGKLKQDPRNRPWFKGALGLKKENSIHWTRPYIYNTTFEPGITASMPYAKSGERKKHIIAFDLTLADITNFTRTLKVSPNGKTFVLSGEGKYIGLPEDENFKEEAEIDAAILKHPDSLKTTDVANALRHWMNELDKKEVPFKFKTEKEKWWGKLVKFPLSGKNHLIIGVIIPEKDILSEVQRTKHIMIGGFIFILILTGFVLYAYGLSKKANRALALTNEKISYQKWVIEEKNMEIVDSINYARRLQEAILPPKKLVGKLLPDSFILFKPKDVVSGDFYWLEKAPPNLPIGEEQELPNGKEQVQDLPNGEDSGGAIVFFAAADCTGHGVPGAMVSVVCSNALSKAVVEEGIKDPGKILERSRELVINQFGKGDEDIKDGMDIALCTLNTHTHTLHYSGAYNPLWVIRKGGEDIEEIKADKQPIGRYATSNPFTTHEVNLNPGDTIYIFSDGFPDQFGGPKGKKFKPSRFKKLLLSVKDKKMTEQKDLINREFEKWKGDLEQLDDVCVIGLRV